MDKLDIFQDEFGWWNIERNQTDAGTQFTSKEFQEGHSVCELRVELEAPYHQENNGQVEVSWRTL